MSETKKPAAGAVAARARRPRLVDRLLMLWNGRAAEEATMRTEKASFMNQIINRRTMFAAAPAAAGVAGLVVAGVGGGEVSAAAAAGEPQQTARERYAHHLAELKKAAEEINPRIAHWSGFDFLANEDKQDGCGVLIAAHLRRGRYEGDGLYTAGYGSSTFRVRLLADRAKEDGKRWFVYRDKGRDHVMREDELEAFVVRKVCD